MCAQHELISSPSSSRSGPFLMMGAMVLGILAGYLHIPLLIQLADMISSIFIRLLQLVSLPIIFLSIVSTAGSMESLSEIKTVGRKVIALTLFTTVIAALTALGIYWTVNPVNEEIILHSSKAVQAVNSETSYLNHLVQAIPSNIIRPFLDNNVISVLFLAIILSVAILSLPLENKKNLHSLFSSLFAAVMKVTAFIVKLMPIAIWAFVTLFIRDLSHGLQVTSLGKYLFCVMAANIIQAVVVLPLLLKSQRISPWAAFKGMLPALSIAFFSKSSSAALPMAMQCAQHRLKISPKVASFSLPLCTTINMNACAAFILTTVLFVSMSNGFTYTLPEMIMWVFIATVAAVGNAGVPMGCYFLSGALLAGMNVPLNILAIILPFYSLIDMFESAINVWSDACVTAVVDKRLQVEKLAEPVMATE